MFRNHYQSEDDYGNKVTYMGQLHNTQEEAELEKKYWVQFLEYTHTTEEE